MQDTSETMQDTIVDGGLNSLRHTDVTELPPPPSHQIAEGSCSTEKFIFRSATTQMDVAAGSARELGVPESSVVAEMPCETPPEHQPEATQRLPQTMPSHLGPASDVQILDSVTHHGLDGITVDLEHGQEDSAPIFPDASFCKERCEPAEMRFDLPAGFTMLSDTIPDTVLGAEYSFSAVSEVPNALHGADITPNTVSLQDAGGQCSFPTINVVSNVVSMQDTDMIPNTVSLPDTLV